jgi:hypothetical protein
MHLLPVTIVGSYDTQCSPPRLYYSDDQDLTLVCCDNTKQCYLLRQDATLLVVGQTLTDRQPMIFNKHII